jgi:hypothetical protein
MKDGTFVGIFRRRPSAHRGMTIQTAYVPKPVKTYSFGNSCSQLMTEFGFVSVYFLFYLVNSLILIPAFTTTPSKGA